MILSAFARAVGQCTDARFWDILIRGLALTILLLLGMTWAILSGLDLILPDRLDLPWTDWSLPLNTALFSVGGILLLIPLSMFLMVPVASLFTGFYLDRIVTAVEAQHYPHLPPPMQVPLGTQVLQTLRFLGLLVIANAAALGVYLAVAPLAPFVFWVVNGFLLAREYFMMTALRRMSHQSARQTFNRHLPQLTVAGILMAIGLTIPLFNLIAPLLGAATFAHLAQGLSD